MENPSAVSIEVVSFLFSNTMLLYDKDPLNSVASEMFLGAGASSRYCLSSRVDSL